MKIKPAIHVLSLSLCLGLYLNCSIADELIERTVESISIPLIEKNMDSTLALPNRGDTTDMVEGEFGSPTIKHPAKGKPPISRWDYAAFSVYFESNYVIHNVVKHNQSHPSAETDTE